jgi:hypothetical protein
MSKGPGRIERALADIFDRERDNAFTLEDLAERVWPGLTQLSKKHRVSLARAARNLGRRRPEIQGFHGENLGNALVFFRHDELLSYAMARLKADRFRGYRNKDRRALDWRTTKNDNTLRRRLDDELYRKLIGPSGAWRRDVDMFLAERDGDHGRLARLKAEQAASAALVRSAFASLPLVDRRFVGLHKRKMRPLS